MHSVAKVLLNISGRDLLLEYSVPDGLRIAPGHLVHVPFRDKVREGYVLDVHNPESYIGHLRSICARPLEIPILTRDISLLAQRVAQRNCAQIGSLLTLAIPKRKIRVEKQFLGVQGDAEEKGYYDHRIADSEQCKTKYILRNSCGKSVHIVSGGRYSLCVPIGIDSNGIQSWAYDFANLAIQCYMSGRTAILATPDHKSQTQLLKALSKIPDLEACDVKILNSTQKPSERYRNFLECLLERPRIIIGNRSVLYAPSDRLGLLAVWDEAHMAFVEQRAPYPHIRDIALIRQQISKCTLLFAFHIPSMSIMYLEKTGHIKRIESTFSRRPSLFVPKEAGQIPSDALRVINNSLDKGPILVQVQQKGYIQSFCCAQCKVFARCTICSGPLIKTSFHGDPQCGWCGTAAHNACLNCGAQEIIMLKRGGDRTAFELSQAFPKCEVVTSTALNSIEFLDPGQFPEKGVIVIATPGCEPLVKYGYSVVLILDANTMAVRQNFEAAHSTLRRWSNAISLLQQDGILMIPGIVNKLLTSLSAWEMENYLETELQHRITLKLPPATRIFSVTGRRAQVETVAFHLRQLDCIQLFGPIERGNSLFRLIAINNFQDTDRIMLFLKKVLNSMRGNIPRIKCDDPDVLDEL